MADDIDDLLEEVESQFLSSRLETKSFPAPDLQQKHVKMVLRNKDSMLPPRSTVPVGNSIDELSDAIADICAVPDLLADSPLDMMPDRTTSHRNSLSEAQKRCYGLYLGGTAVSTGLATPLLKRACNRLHCTSCDFHVTIFDNFTWDRSTEYIFLRNNMPNFENVKKKLHSKKGWRAYACQCCCRSVLELTDVKKADDAKWVCGQH